MNIRKYAYKCRFINREMARNKQLIEVGMCLCGESYKKKITYLIICPKS
jgi:hypothetical protein